MNHSIAYLAGVATVPAIAGVAVLVNDFILNKREYDCGWCDFTTRTTDDEITTPVVVANAKLFVHLKTQHYNIVREYKKGRKNGLHPRDASKQASEKFPKEDGRNK